MKKKPAEQAKIAEFKAHMGEYLQGVREGQPLVLYDRNTPIATLTPYVREEDTLVVRRGTKSLKDIVLSPPIPGRKSRSLKALEEERRDRF
jgi:prevent-host-death family protein